MIQEAYVSYEVAKLLNEKGFDELCNLAYDEESLILKDLKESYNNTEHIEYKQKFPNDGTWVSCPTQSLAMRWLREVHNIFISPRIQNDGTYICYLYDTKGNGIQGYDKNLVQVSYEQACEAALKYCLENLI